jgi:hypothetical protein
MHRACLSQFRTCSILQTETTATTNSSANDDIINNSEIQISKNSLSDNGTSKNKTPINPNVENELQKNSNSTLTRKKQTCDRLQTEPNVSSTSENEHELEKIDTSQQQVELQKSSILNPATADNTTTSTIIA